MRCLPYTHGATLPLSQILSLALLLRGFFDHLKYIFQHKIQLYNFCLHRDFNPSPLALDGKQMLYPSDNDAPPHGKLQFSTLSVFGSQTLRDLNNVIEK